MAEPVNEAGVVRRIEKAIREKYPDVFLWKVHGNPMQDSGHPDLVMCVEGLYVGIEVKFQRPNETEQHARERTTELQRSRIQKIINAGGMAGTALSAEEALDIIERGLRKRREREEGGRTHGT